MKLLLILLVTTATGCASNGTHWHGPIQVHDWTEEPVTKKAGERVTEILSFEDLNADPREPTGAEAEEVLGKAFPGDGRKYIASRIDGSFTGAGRKQTMYSIKEFGMTPGTAIVYEEGREVWRLEGEAPAVRTMDVDGDGQDEWVEVDHSCEPESSDCVSEAWITGIKSGRPEVLMDIKGAQTSRCGEPGGKIEWKHVTMRGDKAEVKQEERECTP